MSQSVYEDITRYAPQGPEEEQLLAYPFSRPDHSFVTAENEVLQVSDNFDEFRNQADVLLGQKGLPLLRERIPVIAYGANANPFRQVAKLGKYTEQADSHIRSEMETVPTIVAEVPNVQVVWHGKPGQSGSTFAELFPAEEPGKSAKCFVSFLSMTQLAVMHTTEGVTYSLADMEALVGSDRQPIDAYAYVAAKSQVLRKDGKPVEVLAPGETPRDFAMTAEQAVDFMLDNAGETIGYGKARELIKGAAGITLKEKKARQEAVRARLAELGMNSEFHYPAARGQIIGRADFNSISNGVDHSLLRLAEQVMAPVRPSQYAIVARRQEIVEQKDISPEDALRLARKALDPMELLRQRAHDELAQRLASGQK